MGKGTLSNVMLLGVFSEEVMPKVKVIAFCFTPFLRFGAGEQTQGLVRGRLSALPLSHASNPHENYSKNSQPEQGQEASE